MITRQRLILCAQKLCARCAMGHTPFVDCGNWTHGVEQIENSESYAPPELCHAWPVHEVIAELDAAAEPDDADGAGCPKCGSDDTSWEQCWNCHGEGEFDMAAEDPINYAPGEEFEGCTECHGRGGYLVCHACQAAARKKAEVES